MEASKSLLDFNNDFTLFTAVPVLFITKGIFSDLYKSTLCIVGIIYKFGYSFVRR